MACMVGLYVLFCQCVATIWVFAAKYSTQRYWCWLQCAKHTAIYLSVRIVANKHIVLICMLSACVVLACAALVTAQLQSSVATAAVWCLGCPNQLQQLAAMTNFEQQHQQHSKCCLDDALCAKNIWYIVYVCLKFTIAYNMVYQRCCWCHP